MKQASEIPAGKLPAWTFAIESGDHYYFINFSWDSNVGDNIKLNMEKRLTTFTVDNLYTTNFSADVFMKDLCLKIIGVQAQDNQYPAKLSDKSLDELMVNFSDLEKEILRDIQNNIAKRFETKFKDETIFYHDGGRYYVAMIPIKIKEYSLPNNFPIKKLDKETVEKFALINAALNCIKTSVGAWDVCRPIDGEYTRGQVDGENTLFAPSNVQITAYLGHNERAQELATPYIAQFQKSFADLNQRIPTQDQKEERAAFLGSAEYKKISNEIFAPIKKAAEEEFEAIILTNSSSPSFR